MMSVVSISSYLPPVPILFRSPHSFNYANMYTHTLRNTFKLINVEIYARKKKIWKSRIHWKFFFLHCNTIILCIKKSQFHHVRPPLIESVFFKSINFSHPWLGTTTIDKGWGNAFSSATTAALYFTPNSYSQVPSYYAQTRSWITRWKHDT